MRVVIADERRSGIHDTQLVTENASERKRKLPLRESGRTCKLAELLLQGTCLPSTCSALVATVAKCKDDS